MNAITASASVVIDAPRQRVWEALTDPELVSQYFMGAEVATDWQVGHPITFTGTWKDKPFEDKGEILSFCRSMKRRPYPPEFTRRFGSSPHYPHPGPTIY